MTIDQQSIDDGINAGKERIKQQFGNLPEIDANFNTRLKETLETWPGSLSPRFVQLFAELSVVAEMSRKNYDHALLTKEDILAFLGHCGIFFNSFKHK